MTTSADNSSGAGKDGSAARGIAPLMAILLMAFLATGVMLPALPLHMHHSLGLGSGWLGAVTGSHFIVAILTRPHAGRMADRRGGKPVVLIGLGLSIAGGLLSAVSLMCVDAPMLSAAILATGRVLLGAAESFLITGAVGWGITLVPAGRRAFAISWLGSAMFLAFALAMPLGSFIYGQGGFAAIALTTVLLPLPALVILRQLRNTTIRSEGTVRAVAVLRAVVAPGVALGLASLGYGVVLIYTVLLFEIERWPWGWLAITGFSVAFVALRLAFGTLPDRFGGGRVAGLSLLAQALGLAVIGLATGPVMALGGAVLAGLGYAFVFPGLGIEALRRAPKGAGGTAMAFYTAYLDLALGLGIPVLGLTADHLGVQSIFFIAAITSVLAMILSLRLGRWQDTDG
ncbi:MFS transporter [Paracoccus pantotrophus]|uniref:MFS transporter n=1 Tax=Paracoccus pantotrophus TaxID=82367 RepID=A0A7H9BQC6_PARPN|nr:MFS transporter [Paracoccus pantotrophus]QLH13015.1 MFS transporter [Paracoccus pantotrophus]